MSQNYTLGALAPKIDIRDYKVAAAGQYPESYQLSWCPKVKNQSVVSSCVAHATSEILEYFNHNESGITDQLSTDFIYGMQGVALGRAAAGMYLRDACKIAQQYGDCYEATIPTNTEQPECTDKLKEKLNEEIYNEAYQFHVLSYAKCADDNAIKHAIMNYGPVLASVKWYDKYKSLPNGVIEMDTTSNHGYHAIMIYGWNKDGWLCQNSWGSLWNGNGHFVHPYKAGICEAWSFVDADNPDIIAPVNNKWTNLLCKAFNFIVNLFRRILPRRLLFETSRLWEKILAKFR